MKSVRKGGSSSIQVLVCTARFWYHQNDTKFGPILGKLCIEYLHNILHNDFDSAQMRILQLSLMFYRLLTIERQMLSPGVGA